MWIDGTRYYFKTGDKNQIILELKKFLNSRPYLKIKNSKNNIFDETFQKSIAEFQTYWKLKVQDGSLNAETYYMFGYKMDETDVNRISLRHPILRKLFYGIGVVPERIKIEKGVPFLINNNETPVHPVYGKALIEPSIISLLTLQLIKN